MTQVASDSLLWIKTELDNSLARARQQLEAYVENQDDKATLDECLAQLHQVQGTLRMVEVYGAAMLAEEMEAVAQALVDGRISEPDDAFETLMRAMLQLPDYLERIVGGQRDVPLALLSLLNDLRSVRGEPLLSESSLFAQGLSERGPAEVANRDVSPQGDIVKLSKDLRPKFQQALLGWFKTGKTESLKNLSKITEQFELAATSPMAFQLWWVVSGTVEALLDNGIEASVSLKQMLGQVDRQIKRIIDKGEDALDDDPPAELVNNLLYYIGRSSSAGERVAAIKEAFQLGELLPTEEDVTRASDSMAGPNLGLMKTVSAAIKEDLARVKDTLDIFVRMGKKDVVELTGLVELLKKVSDTLGVLGLGQLREEVDNERAELERIVKGETELNENILMDVASSLIRVESSLDERMVEAIYREQQAGPDEADSAGLTVEEADLRQVSSAVIRESIINLARVKDAIVEFIKNPVKTEVLRPIPPLVHQIQAGLRLLTVDRPAELLESIRHYIQERIFGGDEVPPEADLDRLADAIVSVEFYLETVQQGRGHPSSMLDNAEACVKALGFPLGYTPDGDDIDETLDELEAGTGASAALDSEPAKAGTEAEEETAAVEEAAGEQEQPAPKKRQEPPAIDKSLAVGPAPDEVDPEILEIFLEESQEEMASLNENFPHWQKNPEHQDSLNTVRRSFHTLKGSGRMVGAELIGEFAWSVENMLNRVIDKTVDATPELIELVGDAIAALPDLIEQLEAGTEPRKDIYGVMERANAFARGERPASEEESDIDRDSAAVVESAPADEEAPSAAPESAEPAGETETADKEEPNVTEARGMDPVLFDIFKGEVESHIGYLKEFIAESREKNTPRPITESLLRVLHTMNGSAAMAGAHSIAELIDPFENYCKLLHEHEQKLPMEDVELLDEMVEVVPRQLEALRTGDKSPEALDKLTTHARRRLIDASEEHDDSDKDSEKAAAEASRLAEPPEEPPRLEPEPEPPKEPPVPTPDVSVVDFDDLPEFDEELAEVFLEEAGEVLEGADEALEKWNNAWSDQGQVAELQRLLHTLKGGARMAGITPMGDLSHEVETLMAHVTDGHLPVSTRMLSLMQRAIDRLHRMNEQVMMREPIIGAEDLVQEFKNLGRGEAPEGESDIGATRAAPSGDQAAAAAPKPAPEPAAPKKPAASEKRERGPGETFDPDVHFDRRNQSRIQHEVVRVRADLIESLINNAGEVSIYRSRLEQQVNTIGFNLTELDQTVVRLREQLRNLEIETEAQILSQLEKEGFDRDDDFDPLEMDRYSNLQQLSRALAESVSDLVSIQDLLVNQSREAETLLLQQSRVNTELQDGLMRTRMVPFSRHAQRLRRIVRQTAEEYDKQAELQLIGAEGEMDRQVLERVLAPLEHMMRNSVVHGIEDPATRKKNGKPPQGTVNIRMHREGSEVVIEISDDGQGLKVDAIRKKAEKQGLLRKGAQLSDDDVVQFILEAGFTTAEEITQAAGRGVGMDVVNSEIKQLGGSLNIESESGKGVRFIIRLPFTLAITQALVVNVADDRFAIPLPTIEGIVRVPHKDILRYFQEEEPRFSYGGEEYDLQHLSALLGMGIPQFADDLETIPVLLVKAGDHKSALVSEGMEGSSEIVVKSVGPQISSIKGISGATLQGDGSILLILDAAGLVRSAAQAAAQGAIIDAGQREEAHEDERTFAMVVDDSITVRRVTQRLLERYGMRVITAKDGVDALSVLQEHTPDVMLLDIEMPRMDGFELASHMRNDERFKEIPIIMITSRTGEKHRTRATEIGVDRYLGKPYQEGELVEQIQSLVGKFNPERTRWD